MDKYQVLHLASLKGQHQLLPVVQPNVFLPVICFNCHHVNEQDYNYCTSCGYPVVGHKDFLTLYSLRLKERRKQIVQCGDRISGARNVLYIGAAFSSLAALYYYNDFRPLLIRSFVFVVLAFLFIGLARWSSYKPFTSLLVSFVIMVTLLVYNTWSQISKIPFNTSGWYIVAGQLVLLFFLSQGVKAAYKADILDEDCTT